MQVKEEMRSVMMTILLARAAAAAPQLAATDLTAAKEALLEKLLERAAPVEVLLTQKTLRKLAEGALPAMAAVAAEFRAGFPKDIM